MIDPQAIVVEARTWVGTMFLHQGRNRQGCDCLGFISAVMADLGDSTFMQNLPHNYSRNPQGSLIAGIGRLCALSGLQPATLITFQFPKAEHPSHAALFTGSTIIHADQTVGKVVEHSYAGAWPRLTHSIWTIPGVKYV